MTAIDRRLTEPGVIGALQQQLQALALRFALLEEPAEDHSEASRWPLYVLAAVAVAAVAIAVLVVMSVI